MEIKKKSSDPTTRFYTQQIDLFNIVLEVLDRTIRQQYKRSKEYKLERKKSNYHHQRTPTADKQFQQIGWL